MNRHKLSTLELWDQHIHSFVELNPRSKSTTEEICDIEKTVNQFPEELAGITVGVKDIIDVEGLPTRNGSDACSQARPAAKDAFVVASLQRAGACILGKTTTTEFAFTDPTNCRNPYDLNRSPGGSSSGSGAAVAAGIVDLALGTQTAGSLCRPAAYCGVVGLKPTYGTLSTQGVTPLAKSFDTVGLIARSVEIVHKGFSSLISTPTQLPHKNALELVSALLPTETSATKETLAAYNDASIALSQASTSVNDFTITANVSDIVAAHRIVMNAEAAQAHKHLMISEKITLLRPRFRAALEAGASVSVTELEDARGLLSIASRTFWRQLKGIDVVLTLPVPDAAPLLDGTTGFQDWLTPWTVFGGPLVCLPWGLDSLGRPRSVMLAAHPGQDTKALAIAKHLEQLAPPLPPPTLPAS